MKKNLYFFSVLLICGFVAILTTSNKSEVLFPDGSTGGYTGSPVDGKSCFMCHNGSAAVPSTGLLTGLPSSGYTPGETYTLTLTVPSSGGSGFEIGCEANGADAGTFATLDANTKLVAGGVTHVDKNLTTWSFSWTAPSSGIGSVTFYTACIVDGESSGADGVTLTESDVLVQDPATVLNNVTANNICLYPNPVTNLLSVKSSSIIESYSIFNLLGQVIENKNINQDNFNIDVNSLKSGLYYIELNSADNKVIKNFIVE